jgi:hypothetical protein
MGPSVPDKISESDKARAFPVLRVRDGEVL